MFNLSGSFLIMRSWELSQSSFLNIDACWIHVGEKETKLVEKVPVETTILYLSIIQIAMFYFY